VRDAPLQLSPILAQLACIPYTSSELPVSQRSNSVVSILNKSTEICKRAYREGKINDDDNSDDNFEIRACRETGIVEKSRR